MKTVVIALALCLAACAEPQVVYRPVAVPAGLAQRVPQPALPDPKTATQRDVALYLIALHEALDMANARLAAIRDWSAKWTK